MVGKAFTESGIRFGKSQSAKRIINPLTIDTDSRGNANEFSGCDSHFRPLLGP